MVRATPLCMWSREKEHSIVKRVALHTLGCKLNAAETSTLGKQFVEQGYGVVEIDEPADVVVINTCSVTERADRECRQLVRRALRHSPNAFVAIVGCYAQLQPHELASIPGVDVVLGTQEKFNLLHHVGNATKKERTEVFVRPIQEATSVSFASTAGFGDRTRSFLKVQDGCDYGCTFCTIPLARGESRSIAIADVVSEARVIAEQGYQEVVLTGVNVGDYGKKTGSSLLALLRQLVEVNGIERIRISSIEPNLLNDDLLEFWFSERKICKHWHIPLQGGSNEILRSMRRRYTRSWYEDRVSKIKRAIPDAGIGADVMTGFPGEDVALFQESYDFLLHLPLTYLHVFTFSERP
ncbi:MAG: tRNA (N(6)-L-threonylcarbamoyladenosine(37)-C(2))-methylthiotransferase MtaB, partial [Ignavibacteriales bacterium]|nr:tRNA (N(6)-L-threonylcarbamoyladenosine(37)-C(2))-methylthiotransferase MtaB [Ignavibacteriales bacterium]